VARCFNRVLSKSQSKTRTFKFDERLHDPPESGAGRKSMLADARRGRSDRFAGASSSTAKFISTKLARRFVSQSPPALVAGMAQSLSVERRRYPRGDETMIYSPEFWSHDAYRAKVKTPFELVVSTARALGTDVDSPMPWCSGQGVLASRCINASRLRVMRTRRRLGEHGGFAQPAELFIGACGNKVRGVSAAMPRRCWDGFLHRCKGRAGPRGATFPWRANGSDDRRDAGEAARQSADSAGKTGRSGEHVDLGSGRRPRAGRTGISAEIVDGRFLEQEQAGVTWP